MKRLILTFLIFCPALNLLADEVKKQETTEEKKTPTYRYEYKDRSHTTGEVFKHVGLAYGVSWIIYPLTQPEKVKDEASFSNFGDNFGRVVFDKDEPFWNLIIHPISGSQLYLWYRSNGYTRVNSAALAFVSSALFEFTIEVFTEPASVSDLYQTPIVGSVLGLGLEHASLYLLNSGNSWAKALGHFLNPWTLFPYFENKVLITPAFQQAKPIGFNIAWEF